MDYDTGRRVLFGRDSAPRAPLPDAVVASYFPYPVKARVKRQAMAAGIGFTALSNGFASCEDPAALQAICDRFGPGTVQVWFERWMSRIPLPLDDADRDAGYWWELSMRQVETSRTLVFDGDVHARAFFEALLCENMDLGRATATP